MSDEPMLTVAELAERLGLSAGTVYRKAQNAEIPAFRIGGDTGPWRFYLSEVREASRPKTVDLWEQPARARRGRAA